MCVFTTFFSCLLQWKVVKLTSVDVDFVDHIPAADPYFKKQNDSDLPFFSIYQMYQSKE